MPLARICWLLNMFNELEHLETQQNLELGVVKRARQNGAVSETSASHESRWSGLPGPASSVPAGNVNSHEIGMK